jgi:probable F420-dependent oxidoreductase
VNPAVRLSIQIPDASTLESWTDKVRRADDLGFWSLSVPDHLGPSLPQLAPVVALASAAAVTSRLRLAVTVLDNDFRHPVMLAKEIATLDVLSDGRVDLGLGAGWLEEDYTKTGLTSWDAPAVRVTRLFESVTLLRQLFTGEPVTFAGEYYRVDEFRSHPRPVQDPVPIMIGARGKRMLTWAARHAQMVNILMVPSGADALAGFAQQLAWVDEARGDRDDLVIGVRIPFGELCASGENARTVAGRWADRFGITPHDVLRSPFMLVGELARMTDHLLELRQRYGITHVTLSEDFAWQVAPIVADLEKGA